MALFKKSAPKKAVKTESKSVAVKAAPQKSVSGISHASHVLLSPRVTEKAAIGSDAGVYVFNITKAATKPQVSAAVQELFKVTPRKINIVNSKPSSTVTRVTGRKGRTNGAKKAYVYLKEGDKIELA